MKLFKKGLFIFVLISVFICCASKVDEITSAPPDQTQKAPAFECSNLRISPRRVVMTGGSILFKWDREIVPERKCRYVLEIGQEYLIKGTWKKKGSSRNIIKPVSVSSLYRNLYRLQTSSPGSSLYFRCSVYYEDENGIVSNIIYGSLSVLVK